MERMETARNKDKKRSWRDSLPFKKTSAPLRVVDFHILTSITDTRPIVVQRERRLSDADIGIWLLL